MSQKTPYQGPKRRWGEFRCPDCNNTWSSGNSWANMGQQCRNCKIMVYPYAQRPLVRSKDSEEGAPHRSDLCEKCQKLGRNCKFS